MCPSAGKGHSVRSLVHHREKITDEKYGKIVLNGKSFEYGICGRKAEICHSAYMMRRRERPSLRACGSAAAPLGSAHTVKRRPEIERE